MHLSKDKHILSDTIMKVALINAVAEVVKSLIRFKITRSGYSATPDMLNSMLFTSGIIVYAISFFANLSVFILSQKKIEHYAAYFSTEDMSEIEKLQKEYIPNKISTLSLSMIETLLKMWAVILLGISVVYEITTVVYKNFIERLTDIIDLSDNRQYIAYINVYNQTHGFKYIGMLIAVIIGIVLTGIALKDKFIRIVAGELMAVFMVAFIFIGQSSLMIAGRNIGVVWTSVIYHTIETFGLLIFAIYIRKKYRGT